MIKLIEETDKGVYAISPMGVFSPLRFCAKTKQQTQKCKLIERFILIGFGTYLLYHYRQDYEGFAWVGPLVWGLIAVFILNYLILWIFVADLEIYDENRHGIVKAFD